MSIRTGKQSGMLLQYLREQHNPVEHLHGAVGGLHAEAREEEKEKERQAVKMLDKHMDGITDKEVLREARKHT